ncbi:hypothetical protein QUF90_17560 [Desulfococcaceae bacterium HSG9]|nr:hypothetical protein [Desulfococcaceae bacterium HSG9]
MLILKNSVRYGCRLTHPANYKTTYGKISELKDVHPFIDRLADNCRENKQLESPPDSLIVTCEEFNRIRNALWGEPAIPGLTPILTIRTRCGFGIIPPTWHSTGFSKCSAWLHILKTD